MKTRIFFTSNATRVSGAEIVLDKLINNNRLDVESILFVPVGAFQERITSKGHKILTSKGLKELKRKKNKFWLVLFLYRYFQVFIELFIAIRHEKPDIIYANNYTPAVYSCIPAKFTNTPLVWHMHQTSDPYGVFDKIVQCLVAKCSDLIIAVSGTVKRDLVKIGIDGKKIKVVYNGIDAQREFNPQKYMKGAFREKISVNYRDIVVGMIGTIMKEKGVHIFIDAIERLIETKKIDRSKVKFLIVGPVWEEDKKYKDRMEQIITEYGLNDCIIFTGPSNEIPQILMDINILVHCSIKSESFGLIIAEAMAMEKLVIVPRAGAILELVQDNISGFFYRPNYLAELCEKMSYAINNYDLLTNIGIRARQRTLDKFNVKTQRDIILRTCHRLTTSIFV